MKLNCLEAWSLPRVQLVRNALGTARGGKSRVRHLVRVKALHSIHVAWR